MGLRAKVKDLWKRKVASCWGHSDETDHDTAQPNPGEKETSPVVSPATPSTHILTCTNGVKPITVQLVKPLART